MNSKQIISILLTVIAGGALTLLVWKTVHPSPPGGAPDGHGHHGHGHHGHGHGHGSAADHHEEEIPKGPQGGRWLAEGAFALEIVIFEEGVPPQFRVYGYLNELPLKPEDFQLTIELHRLGGPVDVHQFRPQNDYRVSDQVVYEPHSFDVQVKAEQGGRSYQWEYESHEGRARFTPEMIAQSGIVVAAASPKTIRTALKAYGRIGPNQDRMARLIPRYPGLVIEARKQLGDSVLQNEAVALVESDESLQRFEVRSPIAGTVTEKKIRTGESAGPGQVIYVVADLSSVWVDFSIFANDAPQVRLGQKVLILPPGGGPEMPGEISYLSPLGFEENQSVLARVVLGNAQGQWRPGWRVTGQIVLLEMEAPVAVPPSALQTFRDWDVVFIQAGDVFEARPVELGRRDDQWIEIVSGLSPGQLYAATNSFVIKADILKSGASHDH